MVPADTNQLADVGASSRIRVLQLVGSLHPGGEERVVVQLATGLDPSRYDARVICVREKGQFAQDISAAGIPVSTLVSDDRQSRYLTPWYLLRAIRKFVPHIVHSHGIIALTAAGPLAMPRLLPRWIHTFHFGNYPYAVKRHMHVERILCKRASQLVCVADAQRDAILRLHRLAPEKAVVVRNGVEPNRFVDDIVVRRAKRAELGYGDEDFVVGAICVLSKQKGIACLLESARAVLRRSPGTRFLIVGGGPLEAELRQHAERLGLSSHVQFTGWRNDIQELFVAIDVFVMPSLWEAMPLALLEAMAARRPIIVSDVGDNRTLVDQGECALLVKPSDADAVATAINSLYADRKLAYELGTRALRRFRSNFGVDRMLESYEQLYQLDVATARAARPRGGSVSE
jgi:glycosyltransferase involved in cell wall biosynthesis